jgi:hypothetical protein
MKAPSRRNQFSNNIIPHFLKKSSSSGKEGAVTFDETEKARGEKKKAPLSEISEMRR